MRAESIDPRDANARIDEPAYRVDIEVQGGTVQTWRLYDVADVEQAVRWAVTEAAGRRFVVHVECPAPPGELTLVRLLGHPSIDGEPGW